MKKKSARLRRASRTRATIKKLRVTRLSVHKTSRHIYAQIIASDNLRILTSASTINKDYTQQNGNGGNISAATAIGKILAQRAKKIGITKVAFDRSGFKYHGRIKALAEAARNNGLQF